MWGSESLPCLGGALGLADARRYRAGELIPGHGPIREETVAFSWAAPPTQGSSGAVTGKPPWQGNPMHMPWATPTSQGSLVAPHGLVSPTGMAWKLPKGAWDGSSMPAPHVQVARAHLKGSWSAKAALLRDLPERVALLCGSQASTTWMTAGHGASCAFAHAREEAGEAGQSGRWSGHGVASCLNEWSKWCLHS